MRKLYVKLFALFLVVALTGAAYMALSRAEQKGATPLGTQLESEWRKTIRTNGPEAALLDFQAYQNSQPVQMQHRISHQFGAALYKELGEKAIAVCTFEYDSGCMHEIFRQASEKSGSNVLSDFEKTCESEKKSAGPCQHALGHGLIAKYGYDKQGLLRALSECSKIATGDPVLGCAGGAFMEYNGYLLMDERSTPREPKNGWYEPCEGIPSEHERACAWWLPRWWMENLEEASMSLRQRFEKLGSLCHDLPLQKYRRECFEALAQKITIPLRWNTEEIIKTCRHISVDADEELWCRSYAAGMFINSTLNADLPAGMMTSSSSRPTQAKGREICEGLSAERKNFCLAYANNQHYIYDELPTPR